MGGLSTAHQHFWLNIAKVDYASLLVHGLPRASYYGKDWQSDREAARLFNPAYLKLPSWDSIGAALLQFLTALVTGSSLSSSLWSGQSPLLLRNCFCAYYWILLLVRQSQEKASGKWTRAFMSDVTCRNMIQVCAQMCMRCMKFPTDLPFVPRAQQEECMELHFGKIKSPFRQERAKPSRQKTNCQSVQVCRRLGAKIIQQACVTILLPTL